MLTHIKCSCLLGGLRTRGSKIHIGVNNDLLQILPFPVKYFY